MDYLISFLEGMITFISPCLLPMLPVYVTYFTGQSGEKRSGRTLANALGFVLGFTLVFVLLGAFAGTVGGFLTRYKTVVNVVLGLVVIVFGLSFLSVIRIPFFGGSKATGKTAANPGFFASVLFGMVFSVGWTPCVGAFLGSALMLAASSGESLRGVFMLLLYSLGLGIPFIASALLIDRLVSAFAWIKKHYRIINILSGSLLIAVGILMASGLLDRFLSLLSFGGAS